MQPFNWSIKAFNFGSKDGSYKLRIEEAEDNISMGVEMLKRVKQSGAPEATSEQIEQIAGELSSTLDKLRQLRTNMKSMI
ncbi:hypothetical protein LCGC14_0489720 [marine sediment metagenome]|uniref:Uncharacterized protein n=1 Tax=marine sediment metagenome TaxID=412755 RepID=A0A0F9SQ89_9ZZZZ